jgi:hypothetical protein
MSAYIVAGYVIALSVLSLYGGTLMLRVRAARRRLEVFDPVERATDARPEGTGASTHAP